MKTRLTMTAYSQGILNMLVCSVGVFGAFGAMTWLLHAFDGKTLVEAGGIAFGAIWVGSLLAMIAGWIYGKGARGARLLDCGAHPTRKLFLMNGGIFIFAGIAALVTERFPWFASLFVFSFAGYWLLMASGRLGVHENGIWTYWGLMRWNRIGRYNWAEDGTLLINSTGPLSFLFRGAFPVPAERVDEVKAVLQQRVPTAHAA